MLDFLFCLDLELYEKLKEAWFLHIQSFFIKKLRSKLNKESRTPF